MNNVFVAKFGGTSMGSVSAMLEAARIVKANSGRRVIVVSAMSGATNQLLRIVEGKRAGNGAAVLQEIDQLEARHRETARGLECSDSQIAELEALLDELEQLVGAIRHGNAAELDAVLAMGERLSSHLFSQALVREGLKARAVDARELLVTDSEFGKAEPQIEATAGQVKQKLLPMLDEGWVVVTQGFIGSDSSGATTTLGRGGSDYSAALLGEAVGAQEVEIWTDVPGILTMDPRVVSTAQVIHEISFQEAAEMANFGAKVLHPATLWPAVRRNIPVFVGSTFSPEKGGTRILPQLDRQSPLVRAIAVRKNQTLITVSSLRMLNAHGFLARIFTTLAKHGISVDLVTTSEVSVALTVDGLVTGSGGQSILENRRLMAELREFSEVQVEEDLSLIAVIGNRLSQTAGVAGKAFQAIQEFNIRLICHGASEHNLCFLVSAAQAEEVAKRLHHVCIEWRQL